MLNTRKSIKVDTIRLSLLKNIKYPTSSGYVIYGKTGSGKSLLMLTLSLRLSEKYGFKVWDIWGGKRNQGENLYVSLPSPYTEYWKNIKKRFRFDDVGAKQYKVRLAYPLTKQMPKQLPYLKNEQDEVVVDSYPFRIPIKLIEPKMIRHSLNNLSDSDITLWEDIRSELKDTDGMAELDQIFVKKGKKTALWKNFFAPLIDMRLLGSMKDENILDLRKEAKDKERIFVLVLHHIPDKFKLFILGFLLFDLWELMSYGKISGRNAVNIREATEFFRATERSVVEDRYKRFKIDLTEFIRQARGRFAFILDAQSPQETQGLVSGSWDYEILGRIPSENDRKIATDQLKRDGKILDKQIMDLGELERGEYYFIENGREAKKRYVFLPPCDFWRESDRDFYSIWRKRHGIHAFKDFSSLIKHIDDSFRLRMKEIGDKKREDEIKRKEKDNLRKQIEEERKIREMADREARLFEEKSRARQEVKEKLKEERKVEKSLKEEKVIESEEKPGVQDNYEDLEAMFNG